MFFLRSLRAKTLLSALIPTALVLVVVAIIALYAYERVARDVVRQRDTEIARISAARLSERLDRYDLLLQRIAREDDVKSMEPARLSSALEKSQSQLYAFNAGVVIYNSEGVIIWPQPSAAEGNRFPVPSEFDKVQTTRNPAFSNVLQDQVSGEDVILIGVPIIGSGDQFKGVLAGTFNIRTSLLLGAAFAEVLEITAGHEGHAYLVDGNGRVIYHRETLLTGRTLAASEPVVRATRGETGAVITEDSTGKTVISGFAPVPGTGWAVVTQERWRNIVGPIRVYGRWLLGLMVAGGVISGALILFTTGHILKPVKDLTRGAQRIAGGEFDYTIVARTGDEIQALAQQFNTMASALKESYADLEQKVEARTRELRESEERLRTVVTGAPIVLFALDRDGVFTLSEGLGLNALGLKPGEVVGRSVYDVYRDVPEIADNVSRALAGEEITSVVQMDGLTYDTRYSPLQDQNGEVVGLIAVATDVTELKRAEAAEHQRAEELEALFVVASILVQPESFEAKVTRVLEELSRAVEGEWVALRLFDEKEQALRSVAYVGAGLEEQPPLSLIRPGQLLAGIAFERGEAVVANDYESFPGADPARVTQGIRSGVGLPIRAGGRIVGTLNANSSNRNHFTPERVRFLIAMADGMGVLLENARLLEAVRESEERYRTLFEESRDAIFISSQDGKVVDANQAALDLFGFAREEAIGSDVGERYADPADRQRLRQELEEKGSIRDFEVKLLKGDGTEMDCLLTATRQRDQAGSDLGVQGMIHDITERKQAEGQLRELAVLEERNRMAREIHDTLAQGFTGIVLQLEAAEQALEESPGAVQDHLSRAKNLARESLQEARRSVWNLLPRALEERPLDEALQEEVRRFAAADSGKASFSLSGDRRQLPPTVQTALLRICQESLTNVRRHARATEVEVTLTFHPEAVCLRIQDNGVGFDLEEEDGGRQRGFGLSGMGQRARLLGGTLAVTSQKEQGTVVEVRIPTR